MGLIYDKYDEYSDDIKYETYGEEKCFVKNVERN